MLKIVQKCQKLHKKGVKKTQISTAVKNKHRRRICCDHLFPSLPRYMIPKLLPTSNAMIIWKPFCAFIAIIFQGFTTHKTRGHHGGENGTSVSETKKSIRNMIVFLDNSGFEILDSQVAVSLQYKDDDKYEYLNNCSSQIIFRMHLTLIAVLIYFFQRGKNYQDKY